MKILMLLPQLPYPLDQGAKMRNYGLVRVLAREHELHLLCFAELEPSPGVLEHLTQYCGKVRWFRAPRHGRAARAARLAFSPLPDMAFRRWSGAFAEAVAASLASQRFDAVHVSNLEMAPYLFSVRGVPRVLDEHNAEYVLQRRAYETELSRGRLSPSALYSLVQSRRLRSFEARACVAASLVIAVSREDAAHLGRLAPAIRPVVVPNAIDPETYPALPTAAARRPFVMFSGKLDYRPNEDAVRWFIERILPRIWARRQDIRLLAVGQSPPAWLVEQGKADTRIVVTGPVEDDRVYLARCSAYVLPMRWGGGVRFKALVALASGRALVSTSMGMEGIDCRPGEHALVEDDPGAFATAVVRALEDRELAARLGQNARRLVEERYSLDAIAPGLLASYRKLPESLSLPGRSGLG